MAVDKPSEVIFFDPSYNVDMATDFVAAYLQVGGVAQC